MTGACVRGLGEVQNPDWLPEVLFTSSVDTYHCSLYFQYFTFRPLNYLRFPYMPRFLSPIVSFFSLLLTLGKIVTVLSRLDRHAFITTCPLLYPPIEEASSLKGKKGYMYRNTYIYFIKHNVYAVQHKYIYTCGVENVRVRKS